MGARFGWLPGPKQIDASGPPDKAIESRLKFFDVLIANGFGLPLNPALEQERQRLLFVRLARDVETFLSKQTRERAGYLRVYLMRGLSRDRGAAG